MIKLMHASSFLVAAPRVLSGLLSLWLVTGPVICSAGIGVGAAGQDGGASSAPLPDSQNDRNVVQLSDDEVLKLQFEKQDSIDRLEKTAAEIARKWRAKQAQKADHSVPSGQPKKDDQSSASQGSSANELVQSATTDNAGQGPNPATPTDPATEKTSLATDNEATATGGSAPGDPGTSETSEGIKQPATTPESDPVSGLDEVIPISGIVDGPIDRLALATSLFATDEFRECLKILEAVELRPLSVEDRQWHDYLAAGCYRKLGNRSEAESLYRSILQRSSSTWISDSARWWLDHIEERAALEQKLELVQQTLENWKKEIDVLKSAN